MAHAGRWAAVGAGSAAVFVAVLLDVLAGGALAHADPAVGAEVVGLPYSVRVAGAMAFIGDSWIVIGATLLAGAILVHRRRPWGALRLVGVVGTTYGLVDITKHLVARARPEYAIVPTTGLSFPSGHAASAAALATLAAWFAIRNLRGGTRVAIVLVAAAAWAFGMALARMVLGVHYMTDVIGGVAFGTAVACLVLAASVLVERRVPLVTKAGPRRPR